MRLNVSWRYRRSRRYEQYIERFFHRADGHRATKHANAIHRFLETNGLLRHAHHHVTSHSTVVLEAESFGVPSSVCTQDGVDYYEASIEQGTTQACLDAPSLIAHIGQSSKFDVAHEGDRVDPVEILAG
jgi:hypothetical protein